MAEPRKVFRIEQTAAARRRASAGVATSPPRHDEITPTADARHPRNGRPAPRTAAAAIAAGGDVAAATAANLMRILHELDAVTAGTAEATQKILAAAEEIDQLANNLSAALKGRLEQELAQDISDLVIRIFEACNFQDLNGQRVAKVIATFKLAEQNVERLLGGIAAMARRPAGEPSLHGPRLEFDRDHVAQSDVDAMFGGD